VSLPAASTLTLVNVERVAMIPCVECGALCLLADDQRWQAWLTCDQPRGVVFYRPECGQREFGRECLVYDRS